MKYIHTSTSVLPSSVFAFALNVCILLYLSIYLSIVFVYTGLLYFLPMHTVLL